MQRTWMVTLVALGIGLFMPLTTSAQDDHGNTRTTATLTHTGITQATLDSRSDVDFSGLLFRT